MKLHLSHKDLTRMSEDAQWLCNIINPLIGADHETVSTPKELVELIMLTSSKTVSIKPTLMGGVVITINEEYLDDFAATFNHTMVPVVHNLVSLWKAFASQVPAWSKFMEKWI